MPDCLKCRGACCETFHVPAIHILAPSVDARRWVELHSLSQRPTLQHGVMLEFPAPCTKLTPEGRCGIYEARPMTCRAFQPGGVDCLDTLLRRRTPEQYAAIREAGDPERIHS
jgi:Fe-S-cluster containining protein